MTRQRRRERTWRIKTFKKQWGPARLWDTTYAGIDYSLGRSNRSGEFHYGVIPMNALHEWAWESFESDYGEPHCPKCGNEVKESTKGKDYWCKTCKKHLWSDQCFGDEPLGQELDDGEHQAFIDSHNDVMILASPYYTLAQYCSPCAPGAGYLLNSCMTGVKTYCFGHDWFDGDRAPYVVFDCKTGQRVNPPSK
jgi:hypothetical protein